MFSEMSTFTLVHVGLSLIGILNNSRVRPLKSFLT